MTTPSPKSISCLEDLAKLADYSLTDTLNCDPDAKQDGADHHSRQVFTGHYVLVNPTAIKNPEYVAHSHTFFRELGFADSMATSADFGKVFSGDLSQAPKPMHQIGWACGYALSIYGNEYYQQCPFQTGNGYGDGRAISVLEAVINGQRWEMQLKGGGQTPYCRGADGRAVLRSSVREFLAQEHMHALGVPTSRSLSLFVSKTEQVRRPWYSEGSHSKNPDKMISEAVAISTRVAPSFIRVGQIELFSRRAYKNEHPAAHAELEQIVSHLIEREYDDVINQALPMTEKVISLAREFAKRLSSLIANWIRVGYCQGNFNSDNCAAGGFTLDYGPFGFCDVFSPYFQPWTAGGEHFAFLNQTVAAEKNYQTFCNALRPLLSKQQAALTELEKIKNSFSALMQTQMEKMWAAKLGLDHYPPALFNELERLMIDTTLDYTLFFRELSSLPDSITPLKKSFYQSAAYRADPVAMDLRWTEWFTTWKSLINRRSKTQTEGANLCSHDELSVAMKQVNPKYSLREWFLVPAYQQAATGDYTLLKELQDVMTQPYDEQSEEIEAKYYKLKPFELFELGGLSFYSCSS